MQEREIDFLRMGALAQRIQGYKRYDYWVTAADDCGRLDYVLRDDLFEGSIFDLESYAFAPKINSPIGIKAYNSFKNFERLGTMLRYITNDSIIQKFLHLRDENLPLFKPYLASQDIKDLRELIQSSLIGQEEKLISLAFLLMVSSKKHNAFLLSLDKQENFYKRMQVFEQEKEIFEIYLENKIDFLKVLNFAFCPTSSYAFAEYLLNTFTKEILASFYRGMNKRIDYFIVDKRGISSRVIMQMKSFKIEDGAVIPTSYTDESIESYNALFPYKEVEFTPTPFRLIDICLLQAFFSARLDLMLLLEQKGANYEIFDTIFSLSAEEFYHYHLDYLTIMYNLFEYEHRNALEYLLKKGIRNQRFLESVLVGANNFTQKYAFLRAHKEHQAIKFFLQNQDNEELDEEFRLYAKHTAFIEKSNAKAVRGIQIINNTLRPYIDKESSYYGLVNPEFNTLLNPLAEEKYNLLPESMERIFVYCVQNFPQFYSEKYDSETIIKMLPKLEEKMREKIELKHFIRYVVKNNKDINYEF